MAKKLNTVQVNMQFNADTDNAKKQVQDLQNSLTRLINSPAQLNIDASKIREATIATAELQAHLKNATNVDTGNLDFSKLSQSLKKSGKTLQEYGDQLRNLGPQGQQAFMQLTQAVVSAEVPIRRTNALVKEFATTLANTARWQLSSSVLHGFMEALQSAYGYAQDLNESLNNIRIVTGRSVDDMADFAKEANKAAKALSTTTTKYTDASLIYYQQGLKDTDVKKRADVTVKLANVSRQSAEDVSNQMTAVWNNFYDGSKSLEHYADVMTALGAATASSTEEIAGGLEKFAAVADTIGLSYEYAASALATITSNTRQSEEVVGTALKTIFARIQGLNLGETLDDGTTLNKYSEALNKVGVNIYDTNGQLKDMDTILNNLGSRWNQLGKDQQVALAQTVAGVRQYNQLIALMDNWNKGDSDSFMANLATANNSSGALNKQADIYAESWEAASDRVTAAAEAIYDSLINDEFFIDLLNNVEKLLGFINNLIEGLGGLKGVLFTLGTVVTKVFSQQLSQGLTNLAYNLKMSTESGRKQVQQEKSDFIKDAADKMAKAANTGEAGYDEEKAAEIYEQQLHRQQELVDNADKMSEIEKSTVQSLMDQLKLRGELSMKAAQSYEQSKQHLSTQADLLYQRAAGTSTEALAGAASSMQGVKNIVNKQRELEAFTSEERTSVNMRNFTAGIDIIDVKDQEELNQLADALDDVTLTSEELDDIWMQIKAKIASIADDEIEATAKTLGATKKEVEEYAQAYEDNLIAKEKNNKATKEFEESSKNVKNTIKEAKGAQQSWSDTLVAGANAAMSFASALSMIGGMWDTLQNPDLSGWQKFTTILTTLGMLIPTLITTWKSLQKLIKSETFEKIKNVAATIAQTIAERKLNKEKGEGTEKTKKSIKETIADTKEKLKNAGSKIKEKVSGGWGKIKDTWNQKAYEAQGGKLNKNGTSTLKGRSGIVTKAETQTLMSNAGKSALKSAGGYAAGAAVAAALVVAAVAAYKKLDDTLNKNELAARRAEKAAQNLADAYAKASQEYDNLLNTISNYDNAKKSLEGLTKGTVEFSKAVQDANAEAMKLIENYSDIIGNDYSVDANGLIQIDDRAMQRIKEKEYADLQQAQITSSIANREAREARITADMTKLNREKIKSQEGFTNEDWAGTGKGAAIGQGVGAVAGLGVGIGMAATGASIGAAAGSVVPIVGTLIGAAAGLIIGGVTGAVVNAIDKNSETNKEKEAFKKLEEAYREKGEMVFEDSQIKEMFPTSEFDNLADELINNKDAVKDLVKEMAANTTAIEAENRAMANSILINNKNVTSSRHGVEIVSAFAGEVYGDEKDNLYKKYLAQASSRGLFATRNDESEKAFADYLKISGLEDKYSGIKATNYKADGSIVYEYIDENGKKQKNITVTAEEIASTLAGVEVDDKVNEAGNKIVKILDNLESREANILAGAKSKDMSSLTISELSSNAKSNLNFLTEEQLQALGFEGDKNTILDSIQAQLEANKADIQTYAEVQSSTVGSVIKDILSNEKGAFSNVSQGALKQYAETLGQIQASSNEQATVQFNSGMQQLLSQYSHKADEITQIAHSIDWTKGDTALSEFNYQLLQMGINVQEDGKAWVNLSEAMAEVHLSVLDQDLNAVRNSLAEISKLTKDLNLGSIISDDDYKQLIKYNAELEKYFIMTADGYKYIGGADINAIVSESHEQQLTDIINGNEKARNAAAAFSNVKWSDGSKEDWYGLANGTDADWKMFTMATRLASNSQYTEHIESLGMSTDELNRLSTVLSNPSSSIEQKNNARNQLKAFYQKIISLQDKIKAGDYDDTKAHELIASSMSLEELESADYIDTAVKDKVKSYLEKEIKKEKDVYRDVNKELEEIEHNLSMISKQKDAAYGADRVRSIENETQAINQQITAQQELSRLIQEQINIKRQDLKDKYDWISFDASGNIINYNEIYTKYSPDEWDAVKADIEDYENTIAKASSSEEKLLDLQAQRSAAALEKITYTIEYKTEINEKELRWLNYELSKIEDDIYSCAEAFEYMMGTMDENGDIVTGQFGLVVNNVSMFNDAMTSLTNAFENGDINSSDYKTGLDQIFDGAMTSLQTLNDLDKTMKSYYGETLSKASEEIDKFTSQIKHSSNILEHYTNLFGILGKENNYKFMGTILKGQASVAQDNYNASKKIYSMYAEEAEKWKVEMAKVPENSEEWKQYQKNWEVASEKARESQDKMLSDAEAWAEKEKAIIENSLLELGQSLEESLTGGMSFDELNTQMERAQSLQEEYLTTTNQIYETTKMMRTAQQAIDASSNSIAKNKLKQFITETKNLQQQNKLSQYELDLQQAKYNLLIAEISLEEAQNAKNTVRLTRDSEGNFGYIYTANSQVISESQQKFEDAQNALYNKGLEGASNYATKSQQIMQEMTEQLSQAHENYLNGSYKSEEEYNNAIIQIKEYYYAKLTEYSSLYTVALGADSAIAQDSWTTEFETMTLSTEEWKNNVNGYLEECKGSLNSWSSKVTEIQENTGLKFENIETDVKDITKESSNLEEQLTEPGGTIDALEAELLKVGELSIAYATQAGKIAEVRNQLELLAETAKNAAFKLSVEGTFEGDGEGNGDGENNDNSNGENNDSPPDSNISEGNNESSLSDSITETVVPDTGYTPGEPNPSGKTEDKLTNENLIKKYNIKNPDNYRIIAGNIYSGFTKDNGFFMSVAPTWEEWGKYGNFEKDAEAWFKAHLIGPATLATGGYTGSWGPEGKLAILHEKEIVLNKQDTENLLMSIDLLNGILSTIDAYAMSQQLGGLLNSPYYSQTHQAQLEQSVHIEASFPGVSDRNEIEEAFNNLINKASQYANRK